MVRIMKKTSLLVPKISPINKKLDELQIVGQQIKEIKASEEQIIRDIREGFIDCVVVFIDLVDSTRIKVLYQDSPEQWIARLMQFTNYVSDLVVKSNGRVVKYIGDEVMAVFDGGSKVNDALNLVNRIDEIQSFLSELTGIKTQVKIAIDKGNVYLVEYEGHSETDPQGTPIDRCARIAKYAMPGTVVTSFEYQKFISSKIVTHEVGMAELKGLGKTPVYQLYEQTVKVEERIDVPLEVYEQLVKERDIYQAQNSELTSMNRNLQNELQKVGVQVAPEDTALEYEEDSSETDEWAVTIKPLIDSLIDGIRKSGVPTNEYGRFLFLYFSGNDGQQYNAYDDRKFDQSIEHGLVVNYDSDSFFTLNTEKKRNVQVLAQMGNLETALQQWETQYPEDEDFEEYDCTLKDPIFWKEMLGIIVV